MKDDSVLNWCPNGFPNVPFIETLYLSSTLVLNPLDLGQESSRLSK